MRVLLISHTCMSRTMGQPKLHCLSSFPDVELTVVVPHRMHTYGRWQEAELPEDPAFNFVVGRARWQNALRQWYLLHYPDTLGRILCRTRPDIVDIWEEPWGLVSAQTVWLTRLLCPQARIVIETEQNLHKRLPPPFRQFQSYSLRHADYAVARSREAVDVLRRKGYGGKARVVPNAVDCALFRPLPSTERRAQRSRLGWGDDGSFVAGYVGRLVPEKGLSDALNALALLPNEVGLALVGGGPARAALEAQARALGLGTRVHFLDPQPLTALPGIMGALDALILPSRTTRRWKEQFGRVLIEAGACGVPVIGSDSGAIPEVVSDAGLVFPEGDAAALAGCLRRLRDDPALASALGRNGVTRAQRLFSWERVAAEMRGIYQEVLQPGPVSETRPTAPTETEEPIAAGQKRTT